MITVATLTPSGQDARAQSHTTLMPPDVEPGEAPQHSRMRFELILASLLLALGLFVLPALIYWVGNALLGPYGTAPAANLGTFYADFFGDLASGSVRTWSLALGPLIVISLVRLIFLRRPDESAEPPQEPAPRRSANKTQNERRVEPRVTLD
jgi:hypothetical protein